MDLSHLESLEIGLAHEMVRLENAKSETEKEYRRVWVASYEKQIQDEKKFLGLNGITEQEAGISDDELLKELFS